LQPNMLELLVKFITGHHPISQGITPGLGQNWANWASGNQ
jgi:hypothetical protein